MGRYDRKSAQGKSMAAIEAQREQNITEVMNGSTAMEALTMSS